MEEKESNPIEVLKRVADGSATDEDLARAPLYELMQTAFILCDGTCRDFDGVVHTLVTKALEKASMAVRKNGMVELADALSVLPAVMNDPFPYDDLDAEDALREYYAPELAQEKVIEASKDFRW